MAHHVMEKRVSVIVTPDLFSSCQVNAVRQLAKGIRDMNGVSFCAIDVLAGHGVATKRFSTIGDGSQIIIVD